MNCWLPILFWSIVNLVALVTTNITVKLNWILVWPIILLNYFMQLVSFCTPWKHQKTLFSGSLEREQWYEMGLRSHPRKSSFSGCTFSGCTRLHIFCLKWINVRKTRASYLNTWFCFTWRMFFYPTGMTRWKWKLYENL